MNYVTQACRPPALEPDWLVTSWLEVVSESLAVITLVEHGIWDEHRLEVWSWSHQLNELSKTI